MFSTEAAFGVTSTPCILLVLLRPLKARTRQPFGVFGESPIFGFMLQYEKGFFFLLLVLLGPRLPLPETLFFFR